jgi:DHA2 family multidrug resistance protein-like MFS transporter
VGERRSEHRITRVIYGTGGLPSCRRAQCWLGFDLPEASRISAVAAEPPTPASAGAAPRRAGLVLGALILVAAVANLNLSVANVALPDIGKSFDASQTTLDLIAVAYSLGLAASVLWFGALGDRYGRKLMIVGGMVLSIPACLLAGFAPSSGVLIAARLIGGLSAGMAYPTTLALITALWSGAARTKAIALWSALGGGFALLGPLLSGFLLEHFAWGSVFFVTLPLVAIALPMAMVFVPGHVNETTEPVDNFGGLLSAIVVGSLIVAINFLPVPHARTAALVLFGVALVGLVIFVLRERRTRVPLYDLEVAARPTFWVAAAAGIIVFGSLMGAAYVSQQFLQNVLHYSTLDAGAAILPAGVFMVLVAPRSAKLVHEGGSRRTLLSGQSLLFLAFLLMLLLWKEGVPYWKVAIPYVFLGIGVGLSGTPSSNSLTGSVPVTRVGMASGTADLQRDLGGALMTSIFGALLTAGYASAMGAAIAQSGASVSQSTQAQLQLSYASASNLAAAHPAQANQIIAAAQSSFLKGDQWAYLAAMVAIAIGMFLVFRFFPKKDREEALRASYAGLDSGSVAQQDGRPAPEHVPRPGEGPAALPGHVADPREL